MEPFHTNAFHTHIRFRAELRKPPEGNGLNSASNSAYGVSIRADSRSDESIETIT